ncbi:MAG: chlororespiratory reduction protein 7 [Synechococcales cyanobacterium T60_A2020_003]|nr:chlororespiratory reduction protein 7 [Synechococcales cyanobacterium T60_A2020_003]
MPDSMMFQEDAYVVLETNQPEQFFTPDELLAKLKGVLSANPDNIPADVRRYSSLDDQARYLMETSCELNLGPDQYLQWYVVRLEK